MRRLELSRSFEKPKIAHMPEALTIENFGSMEWKKNWAGGWSLLTCTYLGYQYTKQLKEELGSCLDVCMFISHQGYTTAYFQKSDLQRFGAFLVKQIVDDKQKALLWCDELKRRTDVILTLMKEQKEKQIGAAVYAEFIEAFYAYGVPHRAIKVSVDFLPADLLNELLPKFTEARLYAEPVYAETEIYMQFLARQISEKTGIDPELILCTTKDEFEQYLKDGTLPKTALLESRFEASSLLFQNGEYAIFAGDEVETLEGLMEKAFFH